MITKRREDHREVQEEEKKRKCRYVHAYTKHEHTTEIPYHDRGRFTFYFLATELHLHGGLFYRSYTRFVGGKGRFGGKGWTDLMLLIRNNASCSRTCFWTGNWAFGGGPKGKWFSRNTLGVRQWFHSPSRTVCYGYSYAGAACLGNRRHCTALLLGLVFVCMQLIPE